VVNVTFTDVCLHKFGIELNTFLCILQGLIEHHELDIGCAPVGVNGNGVWVSFHALIVLLESSWEITLLEKLITLLPVFFSLHRIDVCLCISISLDLFSLAESHFDYVTLILQKSSLIGGNTFIVKTEL